ncbi:MAG: YggS family pyridoxal phosphate-dependent enzyme [Muribaculaceae bacterium]|nr:YggS family pyridoxal phosphate-dependent enzyme [Muribaculaceae bacterium]
MNNPEHIKSEITRLRQTLPTGVELVAVSKFHPAAAVRDAYDAGQRIFAESRVQELLEKVPLLPQDIKWHFIGHLQTNKVKQLIGNVDLIESVDSARLLELIDNISLQRGVVTRVLMQVHVAQEQTKFGWTPQELLDWFRAHHYRSLRATHLCGLMAMATDTEDTQRVEDDFRRVAELRQRILDLCPDLCGFDILSMGMSGDYPLALRHGATHIRIGTAIFGPR